jgi:hypothetical protein
VQLYLDDAYSLTLISQWPAKKSLDGNASARQKEYHKNINEKDECPMSWITGSYAKKGSTGELQKYLPGKYDYSRQEPELKVFAGGKGLTYQQGRLSSGEDYVVLGYPVLLEGDNYRSIVQHDWENILTNEEKIRALDGHWLIVVIGEEKIRAWTDPLGKRSLYLHETDDEIFFTSSLEVMKLAKQPEVDFYQAGTLWHTMFPPSNDRYAPSQNSVYKGVRILGSGANMLISGGKVGITGRLFEPARQKKDIYSLLESFTLAPYQQTDKVAIGLSGGMDVRPLLAVYLKSGKQITAVNYGDADTQDYLVAKEIAGTYGLPFEHISYETAEGADPWRQALVFMRQRGITASPVNAPYLGYYGKVAESFDCFVSGFFGELYRFRFFVAHLLSLFKSKAHPYNILADYLYRQPPAIFQPELHKQMYEGFKAALREAVEAMPPLGTMPNPMWCNLFLARYLPFTVSRNSLSNLDGILLDHMPWLQSGIIAQHWQNGFVFQLGEGVHRTLLHRNMPSLEKFPLTALDVRAPYFYRQYMVKVRMWQHYRKHPLTRESRLERFLLQNKENILDLFYSRQVQDNADYNRSFLEKSLKGFYDGEASNRDAIHSWLAWELGK